MINQRAETLKLVAQLKSDSTDYEWYPTTAEIITCIKNDLKILFKVLNNEDLTCSVLDIGAGDGRLLQALTQGKRFAIEKSTTLLNILPSDIYVLGTDFHAQTLIDKKVDIIVSNPPYSEFIRWMLKIIKEASAGYCYLVVPVKWKEDAEILHALEQRDATYNVIGTYDFYSADRAARVDVDVIRITMTSVAPTYSGFEPRITVDSFSLWFNAFFSTDIKSTNKMSESSRARQQAKSTIADGGHLVKQEGIVKILENACQIEMSNLVENYIKLGELDEGLLKELNFSVESSREALKLKISGLKSLYWNELINHIDVITNKLTHKSRKKLTDTIQRNMSVDFTASNAHAVIIWAVKNANSYFDDQLVDVVQRMTRQANVILYKSNARTFSDEEWQYCREPNIIDRYKLDYRIVISPIHLRNEGFNSSEMIDKAANLLDDLLAVANSVGFDVEAQKRTKQLEWHNNAQTFYYTPVGTSDCVELFHVKLYKKGTIHLKLNQAFICKLNVEFGRLKGWLKSPKEASEELDINQYDAEMAFDSVAKICSKNLGNLIALESK